MFEPAPVVIPLEALITMLPFAAENSFATFILSVLTNLSNKASA